MFLINPLAHLQGSSERNTLLGSCVGEALLVWTVTDVGCLIKLSTDWWLWRRLKKKAQACRGAEAQVCLNVPIQSAHEWKLSINKQATLAILTALWGKDGEKHVETSFSLHPSSPLLHCLIPLSHLGGVEIAWLLHSYNLTPTETCPQWLLAPHRLWLKPFCLGTTGIYMMKAHSIWAYYGTRTVDCIGSSMQYALTALDGREHRHPLQFFFSDWPWGTYSHMPSMACCLGARSLFRSSKVKF